MMKIFYIIIITFSPMLTTGQDINLIIQINERLEQDFSNMYVSVDTTNINNRKYYVDYVPGNLKLPPDLRQILNTDSSKKIILHFTYENFKKGKHQNAHFFAPLTQHQMKQPYLILNIYDFEEKKYKARYQNNKHKNFASELVYPTHGVLIRNR